METWDVIVVGAGGVGSAAIHALAGRGARVLGLDRFAPPHDRGSSHGETRIIRLAYMEHPDYVPLLRRAYAGWAALEAESGAALYVERGLLQVGPPEGPVVSGVCAAAEAHGLELELLSATDVERRFPGFRVTPDHVGAFERRAGFLWVERCVEAALVAARQAGATIETGVQVIGWRPDGDGVVVDTDRGPRRAGRLVVCPGPWAPALLTSLGVPFELRRKVLAWCDRPADPTGPCWLFEDPRGVFYGFPALQGSGLKAAEHSGGARVEDPLSVDRTVRPDDLDGVLRFLESHVPGGTTLRRSAVCLYTMTPDEHFIVDLHPADPRVVVVCGLSGHGFKFAPVLGAAAADLALEGRSSLPIGFLGLERFRRSGP